VSQFYFDRFIEWWEIFKGFPYAYYTVVLKTESAYANREQGIGYESFAANYLKGYDVSVAHQVFHAWVGNALRPKDEQKFDDGLWFTEGITEYYGLRAAGASRFRNFMITEKWQVYQTKILGSEYDIPLTEMPAKGKEFGEEPGSANRPYRLNVYLKGALVAYMMDQKLIARNLNLDFFLRYLYENYGLKQTQFTTQDAISALNKISGEDWNDFFRQYIYGTTRLPLDGKFEYLPH
jgi:predicted metalloprotease with PDZ domain